MTDEKTFRLLEGADWGGISKELLAFVINWARKYPTLGHGEDPRFLVLGVSYEDVVQEVIVKAFSGERNWDPDTVDLVPWLKMHIKSIVDALARSIAANQETDLVTRDEESDFELGLEYKISMAHQHSGEQLNNPEDLLLKKEYIEQELQLIYEAARDDEELELIILAIQCGCESEPRFLAEELNVPVKDIYQQVRRLQRRVNVLKVKNERSKVR